MPARPFYLGSGPESPLAAAGPGVSRYWPPAYQRWLRTLAAAVPVSVMVALVLVDALVDAFGQHHDGEVEDRGRGVGDDRGIDDPQSAGPSDGAGRVHDGLRVGRSAHGGGGAGVVVGGHVAGDERGQGGVVGGRVAGGQLGGDEGGEVR